MEYIELVGAYTFFVMYRLLSFTLVLWVGYYGFYCIVGEISREGVSRLYMVRVL